MICLLTDFADRIECKFLTKHDDCTPVDPFVRLIQVHGSKTIIASGLSDKEHEADGIITEVTGLQLIARAADCQSFAVYVPEKHIGGVLHAGWKGMLAGALPAFFATLQEEFGVTAEECVVAAAPSLCTHCAEFSDPEHDSRMRTPKKYICGDCIDLQQMAFDQCVQSGVHETNFLRHSDCTRCDPETYFTYRGGDRQKVQSGVSNILVLTLL